MEEIESPTGVSVLVPRTMYDAIEALARADRRSKGFVVREAIAAYLAERLEDGTLQAVAS